MTICKSKGLDIDAHEVLAIVIAIVPQLSTYIRWVPTLFQNFLPTHYLISDKPLVLWNLTHRKY